MTPEKLAAAGLRVKRLPSQDVLLALLRYHHDTGKLFWNERTPEFFCDDGARDEEWAARAWNCRYAGKEAFTSTNDGYKNGKLFGVAYNAHRVIWKMMTGEDAETIDHINQIRSDNRFSNLRSATFAQNSQNYAKPEGSSSKFRGVTWVKRDNRWAARISVAMRKINLGYYSSEIDAAKAYDVAAIKYHGEFATLNFPPARILAALEEG